MKTLSVHLKLIVCLLLLAGTASAAHIRVYVLTGQSNSLGTSNGSETDKSPGNDSADDQVLFWWENWVSTNEFLGGCTNLQSFSVQQGGHYKGSATHWGPEFGFGRRMWKSGQRDFMIVKCARGGGGNSFWDKTSADHHMYDYVCLAVSHATSALKNRGDSFEISGLLYLQGESNNPREAAAAGPRFKLLLDNLRIDLPNAAQMHGYLAGIAATNATCNTTREQHKTVAAQFPKDISTFDNLDLINELVFDHLHFNKTAKLRIGERFADAVQNSLTNSQP